MSKSLPGFGHAVLQKGPDALSLCNPCGPFSRVAFRPPRYLAQPNPVLNGRPWPSSSRCDRRFGRVDSMVSPSRATFFEALTKDAIVVVHFRE